MLSPFFFASRSIFISYSYLSPFMESKNGIVLTGKALRPHWVSLRKSPETRK